MTSFPISELFQIDDPYNFILSKLNFSIETDEGKTLLENILSVLPDIERFQYEKGIENWFLTLSMTDDEGVEFMIHHDKLDIVALLLEDDLLYSKDDVYELTGIDSIYIDDYTGFLSNSENGKELIEELRLWEIDSEFHPYTIDHLEYILGAGYKLVPFGGDNTTPVEFSLDEDEIYISCTDDDTISTNPDYSLSHTEFDVNHPEESIERGVQTWTEFDDEDDDWEEDFDDEDWEEEDSYDPEEWDND